MTSIRASDSTKDLVALHSNGWNIGQDTYSSAPVVQVGGMALLARRQLSAGPGSS